MKQKQRVPKGEEYYYIGLLNASIVAYNMKDFRYKFDEDCFAIGNYFSTRAEAEEMIKKLRAVLKGAEVIEMPSEEDLKNIMPNVFAYGDEFTSGERMGWRNCFDWLKSKIVK